MFRYNEANAFLISITEQNEFILFPYREVINPWRWWAKKGYN